MRDRRRGGLAGPVILVILGIVFLLNNLGVTHVDLWDLLRLWPILLIAGGLDILISRRSAWGSLLVLAAMLLLIGGGLWLMASTGTTAEVGQKVSQPLQGATRADVDIEFGVGQLEVGALSETNDLLHGTLRKQPRETVEQDFHVSGDTAKLTLATRGPWGSLGLPGRWNGDSDWDLRLNREVPMRLAVSTGAGEARVDLRRMNLEGLSVKLGVGKATVTLPETGRLDAQVDAGLGQLVIVVPDGMAVRVQVQSGLGVRELPQDWVHRDGEYVSPGYDDAENHIQLSASTGIGQLTVREYRGD